MLKLRRSHFLGYVRLFGKSPKTSPFVCQVSSKSFGFHVNGEQMHELMKLYDPRRVFVHHSNCRFLNHVREIHLVLDFPLVVSARELCTRATNNYNPCAVTEMKQLLEPPLRKGSINFWQSFYRRLEGCDAKRTHDLLNLFGVQ